METINERIIKEINRLGHQCFIDIDYTGRFKNKNDAGLYDYTSKTGYKTAEKLGRVLIPENPLNDCSECESDFVELVANNFHAGFLEAYDETY